MNKTTITAKVEIDFPTGEKNIEMILKQGYEIENCKEGKVVMLNLTDGQELTGIFKGMADEDVKLGTLDGKHTLGYNIHWVNQYFEELNPTKS